LSDESRSERYKAGMAVRREVLGDAHVDRASAQTTEFDSDFQAFITESAWGSVWSRPNFTRRERSIVTIALLAALGQDEEVAMHVAVYAGVPAANHAFKIVKKAYADMEAGSEPQA
jgi:4-carboxymuconolactone decarboxylase